MTEPANKLKNPLFNRTEFSDEKGRLYFYDNAKFVLIFLVVLAHAISFFKASNPSYMVLWSIINTMHMPCFIFVSGFFAKRYLSGPNGINVQRLFSYIVLYLAAQIAVTLFEKFVLNADIAISIFQARTSLWFLQCLVGWFILLPIVDKFNPKYVMIGAILFGLIIGYDSKVGNLAALSRLFVHFPFFMAGYYFTEINMKKLFTKKARILSVSFIAASIALCFIFLKYIQPALITCNNSYSVIPMIKDLPVYLRFIGRAVFYFFAAGLGLSFLALTPRFKTFYTRFGGRTLQVYILHRFIFLAYIQYDWWKPFNTFYGRIGMIFIVLALTLVLSLRIFEIPFEALQNIKIPKFMFKQKENVA
ncbi:MAG: acyltransferase family protein [Eubacteriales bacterium]